MHKMHIYMHSTCLPHLSAQTMEFYIFLSITNNFLGSIWRYKFPFGTKIKKSVDFQMIVLFSLAMQGPYQWTRKKFEKIAQTQSHWAGTEVLMGKNSVKNISWHFPFKNFLLYKDDFLPSADHPGLLHASLVQPAHPPQRPGPRPSAREGDNFFFAKKLIKGLLLQDSQRTNMYYCTSRHITIW